MSWKKNSSTLTLHLTQAILFHHLRLKPHSIFNLFQEVASRASTISFRKTTCRIAVGDSSEANTSSSNAQPGIAVLVERGCRRINWVPPRIQNHRRENDLLPGPVPVVHRRCCWKLMAEEETKNEDDQKILFSTPVRTLTGLQTMCGLDLDFFCVWTPQGMEKSSGCDDALKMNLSNKLNQFHQSCGCDGADFVYKTNVENKYF